MPKRARPEQALQRKVSSLDFTVAYEPVAWARARVDTRYAGTRFFKTDRLAGYQKRIADEAALAMRAAGLKPTDLDVSLEVFFRMPMPESWSVKKRAAMQGQYHAQRPDLDNLVKAIMDACNGIIWIDDAQIGDLIAHKIWNTVGSVNVSATWGP